MIESIFRFIIMIRKIKEFSIDFFMKFGWLTLKIDIKFKV